MKMEKTKRLVGLIHALDVGGAERMMVSIMNHFLTEDVEVHLIVFDYRGALKAELNPNVIVHDIGNPSVMRGMPKCLKRLQRIKPDTVFAGIGHLNIALAPFLPLMKLLLPNTRWIARETNIVSLQNQVANYPKVFDFLYRHVYKHFDTLVAQSEDMKNDLLKNYYAFENIVVINNPIDTERVNRRASEASDFSFNDERINLLAVSRLRLEKRHEFMLEALTHLPEKYDLTIVGSGKGKREEELKALVKSLELEDRVLFTGQQSNPYTYMKNADLFLLTSEREGFPNVLLEANSVGLPIVAFACQGGITEIIDKGENGFFVDYGDAKGLAEKIKEASQTCFDKDAIKEKVVQRYGEKYILSKYKNIILY